MPGQILYEPNPPADPSALSEDILKYAVQLQTKEYLTQDELRALRMFWRAANYMAAAMIFLKDNVLLERELSKDDIKHRLLGHWGTCPGLSLVYAHLNRIIRKTGLDALYVVGPGHGAPAILACLWLEDSLSTFLPEYTQDREGLHKLLTRFSVPGGFPSHVNAEVPGAIHEGGELGYALSVSYGAVMDNPDLVVACVIGDGEAETGPTATSWHCHKYIDPAESGAVLPILHQNGFKISERTIFGCMDDKELVALFTGYGYQVRIVADLANIDNDLAASMEWALKEIKRIQSAARSGQPLVKPRWPMLILRTPKGWTGPKEIHGEYIEGSFHAHQVPLPNAKSDPEELEALKRWLLSYNHQKLFDEHGAPVREILDLIPREGKKKMGQRREAINGYVQVKTPDWRAQAGERGSMESCMKAAGRFLREVIKENPKTFRIFSPDELVSNKLDAVFDVTGRNFQWDIASRFQGGRVIEVLSEHICQGMLQGYTLTGRTGLLPSYEAFLGIIHTMMVQYAKFTKMAGETTWREPHGSLNYIETSTWTRQEHNGFSHQNPGFIGAVLELKPRLGRVYLPPDAGCFVCTLSHCVRAKGYVNLVVGSKQPTPVWLGVEEAEQHCIAGASVWKFASVDGGVDPDVVLVGIGVEMTFETIAAASLLRTHAPELRVRVVNVTDLMILASDTTIHPHALSDEAFEALFTRDRGVVVDYHGYPVELRGLLFGRRGLDFVGGGGQEEGRLWIGGYKEEGTTTSPFDMMICNETDRYTLAQRALDFGARVNPRVAPYAHAKSALMGHMRQKEREYIMKFGKDRDGIFDTPRFD